MEAFLSHPTSHSHALKPDQIPAIQLKVEIVARAALTDESSSTILHSAGTSSDQRHPHFIGRLYRRRGKEIYWLLYPIKE